MGIGAIPVAKVPAAVDQGIINVIKDNSMPSQKKNARAIDASSAPSRPHSNFVGSRFCCHAEVPSLKAQGNRA
jgi:hypothetical protein